MNWIARNADLLAIHKYKALALHQEVATWTFRKYIDYIIKHIENVDF